MRRERKLFVFGTSIALAAVTAVSVGCSSSSSNRSLAGLDGRPQPSTMDKIGASVAAVPKKVGESTKSGASKMKDWVTPDKNDSVASTPASGFALKPDKKPSPELYITTAQIYEKSGRFEEASDQYKRALDIAPHHLPTMLAYGHMFDRQGRLNEACTIYEEAVKRHPDEAAAHNDLGLCYARRGMPAESIAALSKAIELQPDRALYRNNLASVLVEQNRSDEALAHLKAVHAEAIAHYNLGYLLQQRGKEQLAATHFQRAAQLDASLTAAREWADQLAQRAPTSRPADSGPSFAPQVASAQTYRPVFYPSAPEPGPSPTYLPNDPPPGAAVVGNRYAVPNSTLPPTPDNVSNYRPNLSGDLQFLPPVQ